MVLKCLVQMLPESVDQLVIPYQISLFEKQAIRLDSKIFGSKVWRPGVY